MIWRLEIYSLQHFTIGSKQSRVILHERATVVELSGTSVSLLMRSQVAALCEPLIAA